MKTAKVSGLQINVPEGSPFTVETPHMLPKLHCNMLVVAPRGHGKTCLTVNLVERLPFDRLFVVSPSFKSNLALMSRLKALHEEDIFEDPDDWAHILDTIKHEIEKERDDLERYWSEMKRYRALRKKMEQHSTISDEMVLEFWNDGTFQPPEHRWGGKKPVVGVIFDDCIGSQLYTKGIRKLNQMTIFHRHLGQLSEGGAIGCSLFFLLQSYRAGSGGISKCIRNNATLLALGKTKSQKELDEISEECAAEVDKETFLKLFDEGTQEPHSFLLIDLHPKEHFPSKFRSNLDTFIVP